MELFAEVEKSVKKVQDAPTKIKGAELLKEYLLMAEHTQKFYNFAKRKSR